VSSNLTAPTIFSNFKSANSNLKSSTEISARENLIVELSTILEPLNLAELFSKSQPLEVELGCGDASFLIEFARRNPEKNFIGVERLLGRITKLDKKGRRTELKNLRGVRIESSYFLKFILPKNSAAALHIYFPDPWPKKKHHRHRLINKDFPDLAHHALAPGGKIFLRTDDADYFAQMTQIFRADKNFAEIETPNELSEILTDFERDFNAQGIATLRAAYSKKF
jgi:tRNA (guanine-N7-)-methyltransferase